MARAEAPVAVGWWEQAQQGSSPPTLPPPPDVPAGGLFVANGPTGAAGVSAVAFTSPGPGTLRLDVAANSPGAMVASVDACVPLSSWRPVQNGPWNDRPQYDCGQGVPGTMNGSTFVWHIPAAYARASGIQIVLAPHPGLSTPFQVGFDPPGPDAFSPTTGAASVTTRPLPTTVTEGTTGSSSTTTFAPLIEAIRPVLPIAGTSATSATVLGETVTRDSTIAAAAAASDRDHHGHGIGMFVGGAVVLLLVAFGALVVTRRLRVAT